MRFAIALNAPEIVRSPSISVFWHALFLAAARRFPTHYFIFILPETSLIHKEDLSNIEYLHSKTASFPLLKDWQHTSQLKKAFISTQASLLVSIDNPSFDHDKIPTLHVLSGHGHNEKKIIALAEQSTTIISTSACIAKVLTLQSSELSQDKHLIPLTQLVPFVKPLEWPAKESIKTQYAAGREYFVFAGDIGDQFELLTLLKAFSQFKKWQQSNMQLLIVGHATERTKQLVERLTTYKYKDHVHLLDSLSLDIINPIIAGAYAFVWPGMPDAFPFYLAVALRSGIPVVSSSVDQSCELTGEKGLYFTPGSEDELAAALKLIYKDENKRNSLAVPVQDDQAADFAINNLISLLEQSARKS